MVEEKLLTPLIRCQVVTSFEVLFDEEVQCVTCPSIDGDVGIYYSHTPFISLLRSGKIRLDFSGDKEPQYFDVDGDQHCLLEVCVDCVRIFLN